MFVQVNPAHLAADASFRVTHPDTGRAFPSPAPFTLSPADCRNPRIMRLLPPAGQPGGVAGGVFADLVVVVSTPSAPSAPDAAAPVTAEPIAAPPSSAVE